MREENVFELINFFQENVTVKEYTLKFRKNSKYASNMVADPRARLNKFVSRVSKMVVQECRTTMII